MKEKISEAFRLTQLLDIQPTYENVQKLTVILSLLKEAFEECDKNDRHDDSAG